MSIPRISSYAMPRTLPASKAAWRFDPRRGALLVHDMQQYFVDFYDAALAPVPELLRNCRRLIAACHTAGVPVIYTAQPGAQTPKDRALLSDFWGEGLADLPEITRIVPALAPQADDIVLCKWRYSAFKRCDLEAQLRDMGRDQLAICGVYAHIGCLMTASEAFMLDVQAFLVGDAVADFSLEDHEYALRYAAGRCARVSSSDELLESLGGRDGGPSVDALRLEVAEQIGIDADQLGDEDDLLLMGLDSVRLMALIQRWRAKGLPAEFADFAETPTLAAWQTRLSGAAHA